MQYFNSSNTFGYHANNKDYKALKSNISKYNKQQTTSYVKQPILKLDNLTKKPTRIQSNSDLCEFD